jgi:putative transposase
MEGHRIPWPHAPVHHLRQQGTYFVTGSTYQKAHRFRGAPRLQVLQRALLILARDFGWQLEAWAIFSNHYHFVGHSPPEAATAENLPAIEQLRENLGKLIHL